MAFLSGRKHRWLYIIWILVGIFIAWERTYITAYVIKLVLSAVLAILLWPLVLLGISLHIH
jgi:predicted PurR-regulated permease PerM